MEQSSALAPDVLVSSRSRLHACVEHTDRTGSETTHGHSSQNRMPIARGIDGGLTLSEFDDTARVRDSDSITATARLPGLAIEIVHHRAPEGDAEQISINLRAVPSFEAFGRFAGGVNPFANPFAFWTQAMQVAWLPWLAAVQALAPPPSSWPQIARDGSRSADNPRGSD